MEHEQDGFVLRLLKAVAERVIRFSLRHPWPILLVDAGGWSPWRCSLVTQLGRDFLPPFNEGSGAGQRAAAAGHVARQVERSRRAGRRAAAEGRRHRRVRPQTGRAELDEHAEGVNVSEIIVTLRSRIRRARAKKCSTKSAKSWPTCRASSPRSSSRCAPDLAHALGREGPGRHQALRRRPGRAAPRGRAR